MGLANPSYLPPPGVNAWARERSSFKLGDTLDSSTSQINCWTRTITEKIICTLPLQSRNLDRIQFSYIARRPDNGVKTAKPPVTSEMTTEMFRMPLLQLCTRQTVFQRSGRRGLRSNCNESTIMSGEKRHLERRHSKVLSFASSLRRIVQ